VDDRLAVGTIDRPDVHDASSRQTSAELRDALAEPRPADEAGAVALHALLCTTADEVE
jgi:1,4-dihydroxy-2-naphthoyl-CoA synthase